MTEPVPDMDKISDTHSLIFSRLQPVNSEHLKPLSKYSRMIISDQMVGVHHFSNPFINFKIEIRNNFVKRKLDDSSIDEHYGAPAKKALCSKAVSPDLGCFMDSCSSTSTQDSASKIDIKQTVSPQLFSEIVDCGSSEPQRLGHKTLAKAQCEKAVANVAPAFDGAVDDILCLNPFGPSTAVRLSDHVERAKSPCSSTFQNAAVVLGQEFERGDGQVEKKGEETKKDLNAKDIEDDKGYFSMSYIRDLKMGKDPSRSESPQALSSNLLKTGEEEASGNEGQPKRSETTSHKQAALSKKYVCFKSGDLDRVVRGPTESNFPTEPLEGDVEEVWDIGFPIFESSMCHNVTVKLSDGSEQSRQAVVEVQGDMIEAIQKFQSQATDGGEETTLDTSYETSLPLQVQVKSVVVVPYQHPFISKPSAEPLPKQTANPTNQRPKEISVSQSVERVSGGRRRVIFDLEDEKRMYIHSVTRHLNKNPGVYQDAITELHNLMTHVADTNTTGTQWQHPSDLTHRNYRRRFGNLMPKLTLHDWQAKNCPRQKRFANVPKC